MVDYRTPFRAIGQLVKAAYFLCTRPDLACLVRRDSTPTLWSWTSRTLYLTLLRARTPTKNIQGSSRA
jgi:hypothetical protein